MVEAPYCEEAFNSLFEMQIQSIKRRCVSNVLIRLSILYFKCRGGRLKPVAVPLPTTFNSLFEMRRLGGCRHSHSRRKHFQFSI